MVWPLFGYKKRNIFNPMDPEISHNIINKERILDLGDYHKKKNPENSYHVYRFSNSCLINTQTHIGNRKLRTEITIFQVACITDNRRDSVVFDSGSGFLAMSWNRLFLFFYVFVNSGNKILLGLPSPPGLLTAPAFPCISAACKVMKIFLGFSRNVVGPCYQLTLVEFKGSFSSMFCRIGIFVHCLRKLYEMLWK